jgi:AraC-like DNA-binding protein
MQKAHHTLLVSDPADATVTGIAFQCGFTHMGDFTTAYKRQYGVNPSQTLLGRR